VEETIHDARLVRFGTFEVDLRTGELRKAGLKVKLSSQPFQVLAILLERPGEIVTREELQKRLWPETFVDVDHNLNTAINKIREVLGDSAENPRFVETLSRRGYRFIAPVEGATVAPPPSLPAGGHRKVSWKYLLLAGAVLASLIVGSAFLLHKRQPIALHEPNSVLIADFTNTTGDPVFDGTLRRGVAVQLEQSPFLTIISDYRSQQALRLMSQPADVRLLAGIVREVCQRTAADAVLEGSIANLGSQYVLGLRATDCRTGRVLDEQQVQAAKKEDVLNALSKMASSFRSRVGESLAAVQKHDTPLPEAATSSLEALKAYSAGWRAHDTTGSASALPLFKHAIEIDPKFAMAYAVLGRMYGNLGESELSADTTDTAYQLRERASDREKFFITASYETQVRGNLEKAQETCEAWAHTYPREIIPHAYLSGFIYPAFGKYDRAVEEAQKEIALDPDFAVGYINLTYAYIYLDRLSEAENTLRRASERKAQNSDYAVLRYDLAFLKGDTAGMKQEASSALGDFGAEDWIAGHEALVLAYTGHLQEARRKSRRATDLAQQAAHQERAALFEAGTAMWEAFFGNAAAARRNAMAALELSNDREVEYGAAFALALAKDSLRSERLANDLAKRFPEDTSVRFSYLPTIRAMLALNHGEHAKVGDLLQPAVPYELGSQRSSLHGNFGALYPVYVRGEAYLADNKGPEATAEFKKILAHRGIVVSDPVGVLARLQLGRAFALSGDTTKAKTAYQDFLTLWKDADPDIPVLKQAKAEYAKLQ
jgi:DNA-binding winged helix-turn-helix (wHTH) protein/predicted Zn-dependent protease